MNRSILILYNGQSEHWNIPFYRKPAIRKLEEELFRDFLKQGITPYRAPIAQAKGKSFAKAWTFDGTNWRIVHSIRPDIVWNKISLWYTLKNFLIFQDMRSRYLVVNPPYIEAVCGDKYLTYLTFEPWCAKTCLLLQNADLPLIQKQLRTPRVILKPLMGFSGKGIQILARRTLHRFRVSEPMIVQEFIDSRSGIPGLFRGVHDLRLGILGHTIAYAYIRTPKKGSLLSNIALGGMAVHVPLKKIPADVQRIAANVIQKLKGPRPAFYTIDFIYENGRVPHIIELNYSPGMSFAGLAVSEKQAIRRQVITYFRSLMDEKK